MPQCNIGSHNYRYKLLQSNIKHVPVPAYLLQGSTRATQNGGCARPRYQCRMADPAPNACFTLECIIILSIGPGVGPLALDFHNREKKASTQCFNESLMQVTRPHAKVRPCERESSVPRQEASRAVARKLPPQSSHSAPGMNPPIHGRQEAWRSKQPGPNTLQIGRRGTSVASGAMHRRLFPSLPRLGTTRRPHHRVRRPAAPLHLMQCTAYEHVIQKPRGSNPCTQLSARPRGSRTRRGSSRRYA